MIAASHGSAQESVNRKATRGAEPEVRIHLPPGASAANRISVLGAPTVPGFNYFAVWYVLALVAYPDIADVEGTRR